TARIWDTTTAKVMAVLRGHAGFVNSAAFSADGSRVVTGSHDRTARIWDVASAKEIAVLRGHASVVQSAAFSRDGSRIITASWDKTARIWDAHDQSKSVQDLLSEACVRLAGMTKLTREEMRLAGYPDSMLEIDVCSSPQLAPTAIETEPRLSKLTKADITTLFIPFDMVLERLQSAYIEKPDDIELLSSAM